MSIKYFSKYHSIENRQFDLFKKREIISDVIIKDNLLKECNCKEVFLTKIFKPQRGNSKYTKTLCKKNIGDFPVYSANNNIPLGHTNFYDYEGNYLTVSVNGIASKITSINGKFSINADRIILIPLLEDKIDNDFIKYIL